MRFMVLSFKLILLLFFLVLGASCSISPKTKCIREKKGEACLKAARLVIRSVDRSDKKEVKEKVSEAAGWYKFGCRYNHGESCYLLGRYLSSKGKASGKKLIRRGCKLGFQKACR